MSRCVRLELSGEVLTCIVRGTNAKFGADSADNAILTQGYSSVFNCIIYVLDCFGADLKI